jgi:RNA polymerase sigma factor (sigma-70 family)
MAKLTVEEDLDKYLERIGSVEALTSQERHIFLQELLPSKNPFKRMMFGKKDQEIALGHLIDANLRLSFALTKRICVDQDIRARTIVGNLGLVAGITSFYDKPNIDFESHVMKYVREFIIELIGTCDFSYEDIVEMMLGVREEQIESSQDINQNDAEVSFDSCTTLSELLEELDQELLKLPKVDERALSMLKHRHHAFGEAGLTLDEIGKEWGITRERVRQIVDPLMEVKVECELEVPILVQAVELFEKCEDHNEFKALVKENKIFSGEDLTWKQLWGLANILSPDELAPRVYEKNLLIEANSIEDSTLKAAIKKERSKFGLYDLQVVSKKHGVKEEKAFSIILDIYPRSIRSGFLVLARTRHLDTMFENCIAKQLKVASPLSVREILIGLERTGNYRGVSVIGSTSDLSVIIEQLAGAPPSLQGILENTVTEFDFQTLEKWLIEIFSQTSLGILHGNEVVNMALQESSINISSVTVYLGTSPIIRSHGRSMYSLVGTEVTQDQIDAYVHLIRETSEASEVSYEMMDGSKGILSVRPNLNVITSGIVFLPPGYKKIFEGFQFESSCECGQLETIQAVKFTPTGFWTGFTAMIRHGFSEHQMSKGSTFHFEFDFDNSVVRVLFS